MADHELHLNFSNPTFDNCFGEQALVSKWSDGVEHGSLRIVAHNTGDKWIDVVLDFAFQSFSTGHFEPGETRELVVPLPHISGPDSTQCKITRWRPGFLEIPGNGGGEILFGCPFEADQAFIELNVPK